jgi:ElaB/YqjD/DUF883 family membrane-anchored ribosome-binding protein
MDDGLTQIGVRFDEQLWKEFRTDVKARKGGVDGHLRTELEAALRQYLDGSDGGDLHDKVDRLDEKVETIAQAIADEEKKKKDDSLSSRTENRLREIRNQISDETDGSPKVHKEVVELAIRDNAGGSEPTIRRYKKLLQQDRELFPHPDNDRMYFTEGEDFVKATNAMRKGNRIKPDRYDELLETYGEEWWRSQLDEDEDGSVAYQ